MDTRDNKVIGWIPAGGWVQRVDQGDAVVQVGFDDKGEDVPVLEPDGQVRNPRLRLQRPGDSVMKLFFSFVVAAAAAK